jgi:pimeloyl-ACP methyl ester carboxylesterase
MAVSTLTEFDRYRREIDTASGPVGLVDVGDGPPAVFVHGVGTSSHLWRAVIDRVVGARRCIALDLPGHGSTPLRADQDLTLGVLASFVADACDALGLADGIDLVANDTGGAVAQIVAARRPERLRTLTLTNCDTHDRVPPPAFLPIVQMARAGLFAPMARRLLVDPARARRFGYGPGYQDPAMLSDELLRAWTEPLYGSVEAARGFQRLLAGLRPDDLLAVEPQLGRLTVPTLIVWGTDDRNFPLRDAHWLRETIPGAGEVVEVAGARLFFPDERAEEFAEHLLRHWAAHAPAAR